MAIILPNGLTPQEIRILQEFRRLNSEALPLATIQAIRHPAGGGEAPAASLAGKGFLAADDSGENFVLTEKGKGFLAIEAKPEVAETSDSGASAAANPQAEGV
jgi:hypothetical protein